MTEQLLQTVKAENLLAKKIKPKIKRASEIIVSLQSELNFGEIKAFLKKKGLEPERLEWEENSYGRQYCGTDEFKHPVYQINARYSLRYPKLAYADAEMIRQFLLDSYSEKNMCVTIETGRKKV